MSSLVYDTIINKSDDKKIGQIDKFRTLTMLEDLTKKFKEFKHQSLHGMPPLYRINKVEEEQQDGFDSYNVIKYIFSADGR